MKKIHLIILAFLILFIIGFIISYVTITSTFKKANKEQLITKVSSTILNKTFQFS